MCFFFFGAATSLIATFEPFDSFAPAPGFVDPTISEGRLWPFLTFGLETLPSPQCAAFSSRLAFESESPFSLGTTHEGLAGGGGVGGFLMNVAVTDLAALSVTLQAPLPLHAPPHVDSLNPVPGVAVKDTAVRGA